MKIKQAFSKFINQDKYCDLPKPLRRHKYTFIALMLSIAIINFVVFYCCTNISSILMAFKQFEGFENNEAVYSFSLINFKRFFEDITSEGTEMRAALFNTILFFLLGMVIVLPITFVFSYFFYKKIAGYKIFRVIFYLPSIISSVVLITVFKTIIAPNGILGQIWPDKWGLCPSLLANEKTAKWVILFFCMWTGIAGNLLLMGGAMSRIPDELIEAGELDGVTAFKELIYIVMPLIWPTLSTMLILGMSGIFTASGPMLLFTDGAYDTQTISYWIFQSVYRAGGNDTTLNYPSAVGLVFTIIGLPIVFGSRGLFNKIFDDVEF